MNLSVAKRIEQIRRGEVPKGYKRGKLGVVPGDWEEVPFSSLFTSTSEYTDDLARYPLYSLTIEDGITAKTERYERSHLVKKQNSYKVVRPNDYAYNPMNIRFGAVARHKGKIPVAVSGYYDIFTTIHKTDLAFTDCFLTCGPMITYYNKVSKGSLIEKRRVHFSSFMGFSFFLPSLEKRSKIASILFAQDKVIELLNRKIGQLKLLKKGSLKKLFPQNKSKVPEVRFQGFTDTWATRTFRELFKQSNIKNDGSIGIEKIISIATMQYKNDVQIASKEYLQTYNVFNLGDIAFEGHQSREFRFGRFVANDIGKGIVSHIFQVFRPILPGDLNFWKYAINNEWVMRPILARSTKASTMMNDLVVDDLMKESFLLPSLEEQRIIGRFFANLDRLIALHERKRDAEEQKKKALMQLLLTGIVRV